MGFCFHSARPNRVRGSGRFGLAVTIMTVLTTMALLVIRVILGLFGLLRARSRNRRFGAPSHGFLLPQRAPKPCPGLWKIRAGSNHNDCANNNGASSY